ncbi:hypothetical protein SLEP1_g10194 [Rubroshorea leprosula]|uniref:EKC/KEOPS complex subunit GON7 n=1 Tax=Rubroshorea leprosula TaxID=152421 RepID=A0AAV5I7B2_9ROSI|nr:hypothetical protein SLEP1_g10194 [Rubroshorea leprosula]
MGLSLTDALPLPPPKRPAKYKLITQGTGNLQTEVLEPNKEQIPVELEKKMKEACAAVGAYFVAYLEEQKASLGAQRESRAVNAEEEESADQAKETADDDY